MSFRKRTGAELITLALERAGVQCVFGIPGSQDAELYDALRRSRIRVIFSTSELAAAFMASGYYRASGRPGVLVTIPGPGFAFAVGGLAEAHFDSCAVVYIGVRNEKSGRKFGLQSLDAEKVASSFVKEIINVWDTSELSAAVDKAFAISLSGEHGPVMIQISGSALAGLADEKRSLGPATESPVTPEPALVDETVRLLARSRKPLIYAGMGTVGAPELLRQLAELTGAAIVTTRSGRGVISEDHPLVQVFDFDGPEVENLNQILEQSDLILALGCKFSHNGSAGFLLKFDREKLIHVDASAEVLSANYPARLEILSDVPAFLREVLNRKSELAEMGSSWDWSELRQLSMQACATARKRFPEPVVKSLSPSTPEAFFRRLRSVLPSESFLVTDSGNHQVLARRYFRVTSPRGLIVPSDFQSMGFCLPTAIAARLAAPDRPVVALIGDGGMAMNGTEILTAVRERLPMVIVVWNNSMYGQIRWNQVVHSGRSTATVLENPDFKEMAEALGATYLPFDDNWEKSLREALNCGRVVLMEVTLGLAASFHAHQIKSFARSVARRTIRHKLIDRLMRIRSRLS